MAAKSSGTSDLIQIVMLTFFLCALFFGGWGGYVWWTVQGYEAKRDEAESDRKSLQSLFLNPKNINAEIEYQRRKGAGGENEDLIAAVDNVLGQMQARSWVNTTRQSKPKRIDEGIVERTYAVDFSERPLRDYVNFLAMMEHRKPHVLVEDLTLIRKKSKDGNPDLFRAKIVFLAYEGGKS